MVFNPFHIAIYLTYRWLLLLLGVLYCGASMCTSALQLQVSHMSVISILWVYKTRPCFMPFCFNTPCQFTLLNLYPVMFGVNSLAGCALEHCWECIKHMAQKKAGRHCTHCTCLSHHAPAIQFTTDNIVCLFTFTCSFVLLTL